MDLLHFLSAFHRNQSISKIKDFKTFEYHLKSSCILPYEKNNVNIS